MTHSTCHDSPFDRRPAHRWELAAAACGVWLAVLVGMVSPASASDVHLDVTASTAFPLDLGGRLDLELPYRLRVSTALGVLPGPYAEAANAVLVEAGAYSQETGDLIVATLESSLVWRLQLGWRPDPDLGWAVTLGYGLVTLGGELTSTEVAAALLGADVPLGASNRAVDVASTLHMVVVEATHEWVLFDGLVIRLGLGLAATVSATTTVALDSDSALADTPPVKALLADFEAYLVDTYESYVFVPMLSLGIGYRLF